MRKIFTLIAVASMAFAAQAAEWIAADGTNTGEYAPVYGYNFETDQHNQMQYPVTELSGMAAGAEITAMKFYSSTPDAVNGLGGTVTISLANIDEVSPWSPDAWGGISGNLLDVDVTAVATVTPAVDEDGVWTITFDAPFTYTGKALLIDVQSVAGDYESTAFYGKDVNSYLVMSTYGYAGSTKGQTILPKVAFTYEGGGEEPGITLLSEANALEDNAEFTFNGNAVVTVCRDGYLFLRDESGFGQISGFVGTLENGQVLSEGWNATKTSEDGWAKYTGATGISASSETNAELAKAVVLTTFPDESMLNAYVCIENQKPSFIPSRSFKLPDNSSISKTDILWAMDADAASKPYNVYGIICKVDGVFKINLLAFEDYVAPATWKVGDVNHDNVVDVSDVTALIAHVLGNTPDVFFLTEAEVDGDTARIDVGDVTALIAIVLSQTN